MGGKNARNGKRKLLVLSILFALLWNTSGMAIAEPKYLNPDVVQEMRYNLLEIPDIQGKLAYMDSTRQKVASSPHPKKDEVIKDIELLRESVILENLEDYAVATRLTGSGSKRILKEYRRYYSIAKIRDMKADLHPNYLASVRKRIAATGRLEEQSTDYKLFLFITAYLNKDTKKDYLTTIAKLGELESFAKNRVFSNQKEYYEERLKRLLALEGANPYSKNDFTRVFSKISNEQISPGSDYMKGFFAWYGKYRRILGNESVRLEDRLIHAPQEYPLSCEANSAKDVINYYARKEGATPISEDDVFANIPMQSGSIMMTQSNELVWYDPEKVFVGDYKGKQSVNIEKFTGYGVYSTPIRNAMTRFLPSPKFKVTKKSFSQDAILESLNAGDPVIFWYLSKTKRGKKLWYNTRPTNWMTPEGETIKGYIGEHTGVIVGADVSNDGTILRVHFYEGRTQELQSMDFPVLAKLAGYFDSAITVERFGSSQVALK